MSLPNLLHSLFVQATVSFYKGKKNYLFSRNMAQIINFPVLSETLEKSNDLLQFPQDSAISFPVWLKTRAMHHS